MFETTATELPRVMQCIGSPLMPAALPPDHDHEARDEGNAAHWLAKEAFDGRPVSPGTKAYNGYVITDDMMEHVKTYLDALDCGEMECETTFGDPDRFTVKGRADHISWTCHPNDQYETAQVLIIDDFKYGWRLVEPDHNWTLISHAIGYCAKYRITPRDIILRIHQPRPYHPSGPMREWRMSYTELMDAYAQISQRLSNPTNELTTGPMCAKCHALATCPAARAASMNAIDASGVAFSDMLPDDTLTYELETLRYAKATIENRFDALEELLTHKIKQGAVVPGYSLKPRYAHRAWLSGLDPVFMSAATGKDLVKAGFVTPAEAERRGVDKAVVDSLTSRALIGTTLTKIDADREARKRFG